MYVVQMVKRCNLNHIVVLLDKVPVSGTSFNIGEELMDSL